MTTDHTGSLELYLEHTKDGSETWKAHREIMRDQRHLRILCKEDFWNTANVRPSIPASRHRKRSLWIIQHTKRFLFWSLNHKAHIFMDLWCSFPWLCIIQCSSFNDIAYHKTLWQQLILKILIRLGIHASVSVFQSYYLERVLFVHCLVKTTIQLRSILSHVLNSRNNSSIHDKGTESLRKLDECEGRESTRVILSCN